MAKQTLTDTEIKDILTSIGVQVGPITDSTRSFYASKIQKLNSEVVPCKYAFLGCHALLDPAHQKAHESDIHIHFPLMAATLKSMLENHQ